MTVAGPADDASVNTAFPSGSGLQVTLSASGSGVGVTVGEGVEVGVAVAGAITLLKPSTLLLELPVTITVRHAG